jgi:hypothetical protein
VCESSAMRGTVDPMIPKRRFSPPPGGTNLRNAERPLSRPDGNHAVLILPMRKSHSLFTRRRPGESRRDYSQRAGKASGGLEKHPTSQKLLRLAPTFPTGSEPFAPTRLPVQLRIFCQAFFSADSSPFPLDQNTTPSRARRILNEAPKACK